MAGLKKLRYSCLTADQQAEFDSWNTRQQNYAILRSQGMDKANAYRNAGYKCGGQASQNGYKLENYRYPRMKEIISALMGQYNKYEALKENTPISKKIDEKAKAIPPETAYLTKVPEKSPFIENTPIDVGSMTGEQARDIQFYRRIADGSMKSMTITRKYDNAGNLLSRTVVEESSLETRIKAQREVMRKIGIADVLEIGRVEANNINIMIVDASKKEEKEDERNTIQGEIKEVDGEIALVNEVVEKE